MTPQELRRLARLGAEARLRDLEREIAAIHATFPDLRSGRSAQTAGPAAPAARLGVAGRRRRRLSTDARKRIADAQRQRWADWKARHGQGRQDAAAASKRAAPASAPKKK